MRVRPWTILETFPAGEQGLPVNTGREAGGVAEQRRSSRCWFSDQGAALEFSCVIGGSDHYAFATDRAATAADTRCRMFALRSGGRV